MATAAFCGFIAGIAMAAISEIGYRLGLFRSSLVRVDALFVVRMAGRSMSPAGQAGVGWLVHVVTSSVFGAVYWLVCRAIGWNVLSPALFIVYVFFLYISMLVAALPIAGQGLFGRRLGSKTWLEQLIIHVIFGLVFWPTFIALQA